MDSHERDADAGVKLGALLEPLLDAITPAPPKVVEAVEPAPRWLDERELMALIFMHLDHDNPRVCEGIEFERLMILNQREAARASEPAPVDEPEPLPPEPPAQPVLELDPQLPQRWIGRGWADDISTVPAELLDRPQLDAKQLELIARAGKRERATLNLRRLDRSAALRHLQLFIHACRSERARLCRVITGKGVRSRDEPVIKRAVLEWCQGPGRAAVLGWAPQLDRHGEWGQLVLELRAPG